MNGRQVADAARVARPNLPILFITGFAENSLLNHGHLDAGIHLLTKPFELSELASRAKSAIDESLADHEIRRSLRGRDE